MSYRVHVLVNVPELTLILLTWRIWWAPNNASKWQMGFNSAFKGLMYHNPALNKSNATNTQYRVSHFVRMQAGEW